MTSPSEFDLFAASEHANIALPGAFDVRPIEAHDLPFIVGLHVQQFPDGFYSRLGTAFMTRYVREFFRSPGSLGLVAVQCGGSELVGYLMATLDEDAHDQFIYRRASFSLTAAGARALAARPALWSDFIQRRALWYAKRYISGAVRSHGHTAEPRHGQLLYICTAPGNRRRGVGATLLRAYVEEAQRSHAANLHLVSERDNTEAHEFYMHRGWQVLSESTTRDGRPLIKMGLSLCGNTT